jgi:hypothetical protein
MTTQDAQAATATGRAPPLWLWRVGAANAPFLIALILIGVLPDFLQALVVGAIMFLAPGLAWTDHRRGDAFEVLFRTVLLSLAASLVVWLVLIPFPGATSRIAFLILLMAITNVGLWLGLRRSWYAAKPFETPLARMLTVVAALFFVQCYLGAAYFVPPLEDQDMETQGTAYGLINHVTPTMPINRPENVGGRYYFAHPLLFHFWIGESALISDDLGRLKHYHDASLEARDHPERTWALWEEAHRQFFRDPVLVPGRTPTIFLSVFVLFPLGFLVFRLSGSQTAAVGACVLYATLPEIYVRSAYGGYMSAVNFLLLSGGYFYVQAAGLFTDRQAAQERLPASRRSAIQSMFLGAWIDHKTLLIPLAATVHSLVRAALDRPFAGETLGALFKGRVVDFLRRMFSRPDILTAFLVCVTFVVGWGTFVLYGLGVAPAAFIEDHIQEHLVRRVHNAGVDFFGSDYWYPSVTGLWFEFVNHSGWLLLPAAALAGWHALRNVRSAEGFFLLWIVIGAVCFSVVDWRQTKHLAYITPPLALLVGVYWASLQGRLRTALTAVLGAAVAWNVWRIGLLMSDFTYIQPTPLW